MHGLISHYLSGLGSCFVKCTESLHNCQRFNSRPGSKENAVKFLGRAWSENPMSSRAAISMSDAVGGSSDS